MLAPTQMSHETEMMPITATSTQACMYALNIECHFYYLLLLGEKRATPRDILKGKVECYHSSRPCSARHKEFRYSKTIIHACNESKWFQRGDTSCQCSYMRPINDEIIFNSLVQESIQFDIAKSKLRLVNVPYLYIPPTHSLSKSKHSLF